MRLPLHSCRLTLPQPVFHHLRRDLRIVLSKLPDILPQQANIMEMQTEKSMELRKDVRKFAEENPEIAAQMVKAWLREGDSME